MSVKLKHIHPVTGKEYTLLTPQLLENLHFTNMGKCEFPKFENMNYWVKNGICLFYNVPEPTDYQAHFYIGYAEMRRSQYTAVAFRWINSLEELTLVYENLTLHPIENKISDFNIKHENNTNRHKQI